MEPIARLHRLGAVHGDVKPENFLITTPVASGGLARAKLADLAGGKIADSDGWVLLER
jgi:serine/threonine protein kinase